MVDKDILDKVYKKYKNSVNMNYSELEKWSKNELSYLASLDRQPIKRNLLLLKKKKEGWTNKDIKEANKAISYLARAKKIKSKNYIKNTKITKNDIALKNWAYDNKK